MTAWVGMFLYYYIEMTGLISYLDYWSLSGVSVEGVMRLHVMYVFPLSLLHSLMELSFGFKLDSGFSFKDGLTVLVG